MYLFKTNFVLIINVTNIIRYIIEFILGFNAVKKFNNKEINDINITPKK